MFEMFQKMFRQFLLLIRQCAGNDCIMFVQTVEGRAEFALPRFIDGEPVLCEPLAFGGIFGRLWTLTPDVCQHGKAESRILFNGAKRVGCFNRSMLARV